MNSTKVERLNEDIKKELISIVSQMKDPRLDCFWTIMRVETSPDLTNAKVHISVLDGDEACENAIKALTKAQGFIRGETFKAFAHKTQSGIYICKRRRCRIRTEDR